MSTITIGKDLRGQFGPARDQGQRPTCLAFATSDTHAAVRDPAWAELSCEYLYYHADATPKIQEAARRLQAVGNCSAVADWLNAESTPVGPYCRRANWDGKMVRRFFLNPVLKGMPGRGFKHTRKHHETGKRVSVPNPKGPVFRECPHLAHLTAEEFDALQDSLKVRNGKYKRKPVEGNDPHFGRPRKRTVFPGQHARCWYCGRQFVWGGNGVTENLMCSGARERLCWNSIGFSGELARQEVIDAIVAALYRLDEFESQFAEMVRAAGEDVSGRLSDRWTALRIAEEKLKREKENLKAMIKEHGPVDIVKEIMADVESQEKNLSKERRTLEKSQSRRLELPGSISRLREILTGEFENQSEQSPEFGDLLRRLVPEFQVYLVRLCDGGHLMPRARVRLNLIGSFDDHEFVPGLRDLFSQTLTLDLFQPPQRELIRAEAVSLAAQGFTHFGIASRLPSKPTATAVGYALALNRKMQELKLTSPFLIIEQPPDDYTKLRCHKNSKYVFRPLDGYSRPPL